MNTSNPINSSNSTNQIETILSQLFDYCKKNNWAGHDPYDALNSVLFKRLPFLDSRLPRLALTQFLKRSPINFRPLLMIPGTQNPKALAVFLMAFLKMEEKGILKDKSLISLMVQNLIDLRAPANSMSTVNRYCCWGYSFPWQGRAVLAPRGDANLVCTVFVANALLDLYESNLLASSEALLHPPTANGSFLAMATSAADYLLNELYWEEDNGDAGFSYPLPSFKTKVHNANFLAAALFCRIYKHSCEKKYLEPALKAARYSAWMQHSEGSWYYGEYETSHWVDNFHTGYNLGALRTISNSLNTDEFEPNIKRGFEFYKNHFFREDGAPKYFHNKTYPIDIHSVAQSIITLLEFQDLDQGNVELANNVFKWAVNNMWDERGYFYYQITPYYKNKISYMRWSQAWMLYALATLLTSNQAE